MFVVVILVVFFVVLSNTRASFPQDNKCPTTTPCNIDRDELKFFIVGDWGGDANSPYTTDIQKNLAKGLNQVGVANNNTVDFYISVGDHFYFSGVKNVDDPRFKTTFEDPFNRPAHQKLWHLIPGNHDYYTNISAQVAYTQKSWRWNFPKLYYTISYNTKSIRMADFVMMDTIILCGNTEYSKNEIPPGPKDPIMANLEWIWIEEQLKASKAPYLFLVGHYPPRSQGRHGPTTECFVNRIEHLMEKYNVSLYIAGHDHNMQHYRYTTANGLAFNYIVSGLGAMYNDYQSHGHGPGGKSLLFYPNQNPDVAPILKEREKGGFVLASLSRSRGKFIFYNGDANELYTFRIQPRSFNTKSDSSNKRLFP